MRPNLHLAFFLAALLVGAGTLGAHHSTTAVFDTAKRITVTGTLTKVDWVNPHIAVFIESKGTGGGIEMWKFESSPPSWFRRVNVGRSDFAKALGQAVTVEANPAKDGSMYGYLVKIVFGDKTSLELLDQSLASGK